MQKLEIIYRKTCWKNVHIMYEMGVDPNDKCTRTNCLDSTTFKCVLMYRILPEGWKNLQPFVLLSCAHHSLHC